MPIPRLFQTSEAAALFLQAVKDGEISQSRHQSYLNPAAGKKYQGMGAEPLRFAALGKGQTDETMRDFLAEGRSVTLSRSKSGAAGGPPSSVRTAVTGIVCSWDFLRSWCWATLIPMQEWCPISELLRYPIEKDDTDTMLAVSRLCSADTRGCCWSGCWAAGWITPLPISRHWCTRWSTERQHRYRQQLLYHRHQGEDRQRRFHISRDFTFSVFSTRDCASGVCIRHAKQSWRQQITNWFSHRGQQSFGGQPAQISVKGILCDSLHRRRLSCLFTNKRTA